MARSPHGSVAAGEIYCAVAFSGAGSGAGGSSVACKCEKGHIAQKAEQENIFFLIGLCIGPAGPLPNARTTGPPGDNGMIGTWLGSGWRDLLRRGIKRSWFGGRREKSRVQV